MRKMMFWQVSDYYIDLPIHHILFLSLNDTTFCTALPIFLESLYLLDTGFYLSDFRFALYYNPQLIFHFFK
jgi:hypothetical protein